MFDQPRDPFGPTTDKGKPQKFKLREIANQRLDEIPAVQVGEAAVELLTAR